MSLKMSLGSKTKYFFYTGSINYLRLELDQPILSNDELCSIVNLKISLNGKLKTSKVDILFKNSNSETNQKGIDKICYEVKSQIKDGSKYHNSLR